VTTTSSQPPQSTELVDVTVLRYSVLVGPMLKWALIVVMVVGQAAVSAALKMSVSLRFSHPGAWTESRSGKGTLTRKSPNLGRRQQEQ